MPASELHADRDDIAVILVDHGSKIDESNALLEKIVDGYRRQYGWKMVEPAHMELAEPSIAIAFQRCVEQGAKLVVVMPYFLGPGRHWSEDIPRLAAEANAGFPAVKHLVTAPLGLHELLLRVVDERVNEALADRKHR